MITKIRRPTIMAEMRRLLMPGKPRNGTVWNSG
jgi:hypothetical protein